jgi:hypothetical protein
LLSVWSIVLYQKTGKAFKNALQKKGAKNKAGTSARVKNTWQELCLRQSPWKLTTTVILVNKQASKPINYSELPSPGAAFFKKAFFVFEKC